jgi:hypothetical protein
VGAQEQKQKKEHQDDGRGGGEPAVLGLVADPGVATHMVRAFANELPRLIADSGGAERPGGWRIETSSQLLPLEEDGTLPLLRIGRQQREENGWDVTIVVTELPRRAGNCPILADYVPGAAVGLVSLPALGAVRLERRVRDTIVHLMSGDLTDHNGSRPRRKRAAIRRAPEIGLPYEYVSESEANEAAAAARPDGEGGDGAGGGESAAAAVEGNVEEGGSGAPRHIVLTGLRGRLQLLSGMVRANRPWRLVPSLSPALAGAAAGAAFGIFYSNIWLLADAFSGARLGLVNAVAVLSMIAWLIFDNNLWERPRNRRLREEAVLYNAVTVLTVSFGVMCMYVVLFTVTMLASLAVIPSEYLSTTLQHPVSSADFATIAWLSASMGTLAGALGSGLAGEGAVRRAAYSARERERQVQRDERERRSDREATPAEEYSG